MSNKKVFITINVSPEHFQNMEIRGSCSNPAIYWLYKLSLCKLTICGNSCLFLHLDLLLHYRNFLITKENCHVVKIKKVYSLHGYGL
jgi:hypothetical protein